MRVELERLEKLFKALANKRRLELLKILLENGEMSVGEISERFKIPFKTVSRNLHILYQVDLVTAKNKRNYIYYSIKKEGIHSDNVALLALIKRMGRKTLKDTEPIKLLSAAMFDPRLSRYLKILSGEE